MKKTIFIISAILFCTVSCKDMLELSPSDEITQGNMWTTPSLAEKGMAGLYRIFHPHKLSSETHFDRLTSGLNRAGIESLGFASDMYTAGHHVRLLTDAVKRASDWQISYEWKFCYTIIHAANDAIANLGKAGLSKEMYESYMSEAKFLRAWAYHRLNCLFQGVPMYETPINNEECTKSQSSAEEIWGLCLKDLKYAIDCASFPEKSDGRANKAAAYALRGQIHMWMKQYSLAINDFEAVKSCGYDLWHPTAGETYCDLFTIENEHCREMIFTIEFSNETGYTDNWQYRVGNWDCYTGWGDLTPSCDFIDYFENSDGSEFNWASVPGMEDWYSLKPSEREVFFLRDGLLSNGKYESKVQELRKSLGPVFDSHYLNDGNEARLMKAYSDRDPRLNEIVLLPYTPYDCYVSGAVTPDRDVLGKELRWPFYRLDADGGDIRVGKSHSFFPLYKKYVEHKKGHIQSRSYCHCDWPLIRYTDVYLLLAEAYYHSNREGEALAIVNEVRNRAGTRSVLKSGEGLMEQIRYERRIEMAQEGIDFFDEVRWGTFKKMKFQDKDQHGNVNLWGEYAGLAWYYDECLWPWGAPLAEVQRNTNLIKRDGWQY